VDYVARNDQRKPVGSRPRYQVCEVEHEIKDEATGKTYPLRWVFSWNSNKAELDARQRLKELEAGEQALQKMAHLLGKYSYTSRAVILDRLEKLLKKAPAAPTTPLSGTPVPNTGGGTITTSLGPTVIQNNAGINATGPTFQVTAACAPNSTGEVMTITNTG
jgi:hypothetical protein